MMMGELIKQYINGILSDDGKPPKEPEDVSQVWIESICQITTKSALVSAAWVAVPIVAI